jgi:hypothetical protein
MESAESIVDDRCVAEVIWVERGHLTQRLANSCTGFPACADGQRNQSGGVERWQRRHHEVQAEALGVGNGCSMTSDSAEAKWAGAGELLGVVGLGSRREFRLVSS